MNYHSDEWIMAGLQRHYEIVLQRIPKERIVGMALWGSQNVGLDHENSDIDSACIFIPTLEQIAAEPEWVEEEKIVIGKELIRLIDVRLMSYGLSICSLFHLERAYTQYKIIPNEQYVAVWESWRCLADELVKYNRPAAAKSLAFYMRNSWLPQATNNFARPRKEICMQLGYDYKKVAYVIRGYFLFKLLLTDYAFSYSLNYHLNQLALDAKMQKYDTLSAHWLIRFIERDYWRLYDEIIKQYPVDEEMVSQLINKLEHLNKKILTKYYGNNFHY